MTEASGVPASEPRRVPVRVRLSDERVELLTPTQREDLAALTKILEARLFTWDRVDVVLPATVFDAAAKPLVSLEDLLKEPQAGELERLAIAHGRLAAAQLAEIRRTATFSVDSLDYPGQRHEWKVAGILQKGREPIAASWREDLARAASLYVVSIPDLLKGHGTLSVKTAARRVVEGLVETAGLFVGFPELRPRWSGAEIEEARRKELFVFMRQALASKDVGPYDPELMKSAAPILAECEELAAQRWQARTEAFAAELSASGVEAAEIPARLARAEQEELFTAILGSKRLGELRPGLGKLLVQRASAALAIKEIREEDARGESARRDEAAATLRAEHPVLSLIPRWLGERVDAAQKVVIVAPPDARIDAALAGLGLAEELKAERGFALSWAPRGDAMRAQRTGSREFAWASRIWRRRDYTAERDPKTGEWSGSRHRTRVVSSAAGAWRLRNIFWRGLTAANNALYFLLVENLFKGPLGVRSLFGARPFAPYERLDPRTGVWGEWGGRQTYVGRIRGFWAQRRGMLDALARKSSHAFFLGRSGERVVLFFSADLALGLVAPLIVAVVQPLLTAVNVAVSLSLAAATPVLAPIYAVGVWLLQATVYDAAGSRYYGWRPGDAQHLPQVGILFWGAVGWFAARHYHVRTVPGGVWALAAVLLAGTGPLFPWVGTFVKKTCVYGVGAAALSLVFAALAALLAPVLAALAALRRLLRTGYDAVLSLPLRRLARVPAASGFFVRRTAGPGLSSEYYFQVSADVPLVAAQAALESKELARCEASATALIAAPARAYAQWAAVVDALTGGGNAGRPEAPAYAEIAAQEKPRREALEKAVGERKNHYDRLLNVPHRGLIKLPRPDLELLLKKTAVLARDFYARAMKGWTPEETAAFWKEAGLRAQDWGGLARKIQSTVFGAAILVPLEDADATLRIRIDAPDLDSYARGLDRGILPGQLDDVTIGELPRPAPSAAPRPPAPKVSACELLAPLLSAAAS